jgi:glycogen debranching enzyme
MARRGVNEDIYMYRKRLFPLVFLTLCLPSPVWAQIAQQSVPTRSTTENLAAKRYVAAGDRAYIVGTQDGGFPGMGFHISGQMNGVWAHPLKLLDSYAFFLDGSAFPAATKFTSGPGFVQLDYPATSDGWQVSQTEFAPDGLPVALIRLRIHNVSNAPSTRLTFQPTSEILPAYPWSSTTQTSDSLDQADLVTFDPRISGLVFQDPPTSEDPTKQWYAVAAGAVKQSGPQDTVQFSGASSLLEHLGPFGKRASGQLSWQVTVAPGSTVNLWVAIAGTNTNKAEAYGALLFGLFDPQALLRQKIQSRLDVLAQSDAQIPDPTIQDAFNWAKFNLADMRRIVTDAQIRDTMEGTVYPAPLAFFPLLSGFGAGYPDYPWFFTTDGAFTTYGLTATGQWDEAKNHLQTLREVSIAVNKTTGKLLHEIVTDGSIYFGTVGQPGDVQETAQFASAVATLWRWSGDDAFLDENYDFINRGLHYITSVLDTNNDGWPEGSGIEESTGMGAEKLDVAVYTIRALNDLEEMAAKKGDLPTRNFARHKARELSRKFDGDWWEPDLGLFADSLALDHQVMDDPNQTLGPAPINKLQTFFWINAIPMEADIALPEHAEIAFQTLESARFTDLAVDDPTSGGFYQQGRGPNIAGTFQASAVNTGVMAVAEANYGRTDLSLQYATFIAKELDREQPGALPELFPSLDYDYFQVFPKRAMVMQAWSSYGVEWPVVYDYLGIRPDLPQCEISIIPQLPSAWPNLSINNVRIGNGTVSVSTSHAGNQYTTTATVPRGLRVHLGYALPANSNVATVTLNGHPAAYELKVTHRGREIIVTTNSGETQQLVVIVQ